jgi:hypothetical protein
MTTNERINEALLLAKQGNLATARSILLLAEGHVPSDQMDRAWAKFGKIWRGE